MLKRLVLASASLILAMSLTACSGGGGNNEAAPAGGSSVSSGKTQNLAIMDWGGAITEAHKKAIFEPFEKKNNVKITVVSPTDYGKFKAMVESGNVEFDVVNVDSDFVIRGGKQGLLEKLDYNVIKKDDIIPQLVDDYGIGAELFSTAISYNTSKFPTGSHPKNWAEFWDTKKFPGPRSLWKYPTGTLEAALLADGVAPDKLYPLDVDRAFASLDKIKKDVKVWWNAGAQPPQLLANGEVVLAEAWNGRVSTAKKQGAPEDVEFNQGLIMGDSWVVPKGVQNKDLAMKFIAFAIAPEQQAAFSSSIDYAPVNKKALDLLSPEVKERLGQSPDKAKSQIVVDIKWWVDNFDKVNERFEQWLLK
ncbi:ABC transporter substrate-binding protein [Aneurinibacillus tyrosinisolvens]|uniref:ABC transporter substrate-binding protein n=1 Tax=Aneurinibacillus tyrosinisolvens TaxID=1443435 RepID=UPI00069BBD41|nr:ABC transporter substrate-binding protein [Aneurinibacillus tyrosinisolvens]